MGHFWGRRFGFLLGGGFRGLFHRGFLGGLLRGAFRGSSAAAWLARSRFDESFLALQVGFAATTFDDFAVLLAHGVNADWIKSEADVSTFI